MMVPIFFVCLLLALNGANADIPPVRLLGSTEMQYAAFAQVLHNSVSGTEDLVVSTFGAFGKDEVFVVRDIKYQVEQLDSGKDLEKDVLFDDLPWPNELEEVPADVLNRDDLWWSASGFLVPGKEDGKVAFVEVSKDVPAVKHVISTNPDPKGLWWYHRVAFKDMNGDGRQDALSSRAYLQSDGNAKAEMVWFEQPATDALTSLWPEHVMYSGPDAVFRLETLPVPGGGTRDVIISTEYFAEKLVVSWVEPGGSWTDPTTIQHLVIDAVVDERYFDSVLTDLNMDGSLDLLVSINSDKNGKLVAYEIPPDFRTGPWVRHDLATGFKPQNVIITEGNGAPGMTFVFYPKDPAIDGRNKPMIILTGDDDGSVYLFESKSDSDPSEWEYNMEEIVHFRGTVGTPAIKDIDHDGYAEIFIPAYSDGQLYVYTFKPPADPPLPPVSNGIKYDLHESHQYKYKSRSKKLLSKIAQSKSD